MKKNIILFVNCAFREILGLNSSWNIKKKNSTRDSELYCADIQYTEQVRLVLETLTDQQPRLHRNSMRNKRTRLAKIRPSYKATPIGLPNIQYIFLANTYKKNLNQIQLTFDLFTKFYCFCAFLALHHSMLIIIFPCFNKFFLNTTLKFFYF